MDFSSFNIEEFDIKLGTDEIGRNFILFGEVESTNSILLSTKEFDKHGTVVFAEKQTSGRGRKNRVWESQPEQNLMFSILLKKFDQKAINIINLGAAIAVAQSIENLYQLKTELKWPNDVLINKKKVSGILLESSSKGNKITKVVIGIGVNVNQPNFPGKYLIEPTSIRKEFRSNVSREKLLSEILTNFENIIKEVHSNPARIVDDWKEKCRMIGEKVKIIEEDKTKFGVFEDIDENGFLILKQEDKLEKIHFGDVSLR